MYQEAGRINQRKNSVQTTRHRDIQESDAKKEIEHDERNVIHSAKQQQKEEDVTTHPAETFKSHLKKQTITYVSLVILDLLPNQK